MDLLGLGVAGTAILIALGGAAYANFLGKFTSGSGSKVDWKEVGKTFGIAIVVGIPMAATALEQMGEVSEAAQLTIIFTMVNSIAGLDFGIKRLAKIIGKAKAK